ncbi:hypothetical protein ACIA74_43760 [Streptomyces sp. NPDC051658]|uniref:hypothetical protein n=1 Tax=Streptomyces sp. NPDC051658 TaxID=3365667 RepID=UPI003792CE2B
MANADVVPRNTSVSEAASKQIPGGDLRSYGRRRCGLPAAGITHHGTHCTPASSSAATVPP